MDSHDRNKLLQAGYRILRIYPTEKCIRELSGKSWKLVARYPSIAKTQRALDILRKDNKTLVD